MKNFDNVDTSEIVCPYCGFEYCDSWNQVIADGDEICPECGKEFAFSICYAYTTYKIEED